MPAVLPPKKPDASASLRPLADAAMFTCVRAYDLGPNRYHEALILMEAGNAALSAVVKADDQIRAISRP